MATLARYPEVVESAALAHEPHVLAYYLRELANDFHTYYNAHTFIVDDAALRDARLNLIDATRQVLANASACSVSRRRKPCRVPPMAKTRRSRPFQQEVARASCG